MGQSPEKNSHTGGDQKRWQPPSHLSWDPNSPFLNRQGGVTTEKCPSLLPPTRSSPKDFQGLERLPEASSRLQLPETLLCLVVSPKVSFSLEHFPPTPAAADANTA